MSYPHMTVTLSRNTPLFTKAVNFNWSMMHTDDDYTLVMKALAFANDALVPAAFVTPPDWVSQWDARKALSQFAFGMLTFLSLPMETVRRATSPVLDDVQYNNVYEVVESRMQLPARMLTLALTHAATYANGDVTLDDLYQSLEGGFGALFSGWSLTNDTDPDTVIVNLSDCNDLDLKLYDYDKTDTVRTIVTSQDAAGLHDLAALTLGRILHSSGYSKFGPNPDMNTALAETTALGRVFRHIANGQEVKFRFTLDGTTLTDAVKPHGTRYSDKFSPEDAGSDSLMNAIMYAMTTSDPTFERPSIRTGVTVSELTWLFYALDKTYAKHGSILPLYMDDQHKLEPNKIVKKYTRKSPSDFGVEYSFARKIDGEVSYQPSFTELSEQAIAAYRNMLPDRSPANGYIFPQTPPTDPNALVYTDSVTGRTVYMLTATEVAATTLARPIGGKNIRMLYNLQDIKEGVLGTMRYALGYFEKFGLRTNGVYVYLTYNSDGTLVNYGFVDLDTYCMIDLSDELACVCDQLEVVLEANEKLRDQAEVYGDVIDTTEEERSWWQNLWNYLKKHPLLLILILILLAFAVLKYVVPSFNKSVGTDKH